MSNFFTVPDKEKNYQSYMVFVLAVIWCIITSLIVSLGLYFFPHVWQRWVLFIGVSLFITFFNLYLNRSGHVKLASWSLTLMLWLFYTIPCYTAGGIFAPGILTQMSVILTAGFLLGWRGGLAIGLLTMATDFWFVYLEVNGKLPVPSVIHTPLTRWLGAIIPFGTIIALQYYATSHLHAGLNAMKREITKREEAEKAKNQTLYDLGERVKELRTLYEVSRILQNECLTLQELFINIAETLPGGWQYPHITEASLVVEGTAFSTANFRPTQHRLTAGMTTTKGTPVSIEVVYLEEMPSRYEGPFLKEERSLINMLAEMIKADLERRERNAELSDYKYALDIASIVSISDVNGVFTFVNDNFCKTSKYDKTELLGASFSMLWTKSQPEEYLKALENSMQNGKPHRGEFCNRAKDGSLYWVDSTIVPFLDANGRVYQYLSINQDITDRKHAEEKMLQNELLLRKITSQVPGNTYMFEIAANGQTNILFMNKGTDPIMHPNSTEEVMQQSELLREVLHEADKEKFNDAMKKASATLSNISFQYRVRNGDSIRWRWMQAVPEKNPEGKIIWYGSTSDITPLVNYIVSIEQMIYDVSHVLRRPISNLLGVTTLISDDMLTTAEIREMSKTLHEISKEIDQFIRELNHVYNQKRQNALLDIDISSEIDKRFSLFKWKR